MKLSIVAGATSQSVNIFVQDSSSTTGAGLSGLVYNTSGLIAYFTFAGANATATAITLATLATVTTAWASGGFVEIDATHMKGLYRLDLPNAVLAAAKGRSVVAMLSGAANMAPCVLEIELTGWDNQDAIHGGLSALPNTAVTTNASLLTSGTGTDQLSVTSGRIDLGKALGTAVTLDANNTLNVSAKYLAGTALTGRDIGASVLLSPGTGTGQIDIASGVVTASLSGDLTATMKTSVENAVWNAATSAHTTSGSTGAAIIAAGSAGDPWSTAIPGSYGAGTAGSIVGTNLNATVSSQLASSSITLTAGNVTVGTNNDKTGYSLSQAFPTNFGSLTISAGGVVESNLGQILGTALTETSAGYLEAGFKKLFDVAIPVLTAASVNQTGDSYARLGAPAGASVSADIAAVKSDTGSILTDAAAIKAQTDKLAFTVANQVDANVLDWKSVAAPAMTGDAYARLGAPAGASVSADIAAVKSDTGTILTDVNSGAGAIYSRLGAPAGASMSADIAALKTDLDGGVNATSIAGNATAATLLEKSANKIGYGTVGSASTTTSVVTSAMSPANTVAGQFQGRIMIFDNGTTTANLRGQATVISTDNGSGTFSVAALTDAPVSGDTFVIL